MIILTFLGKIFLHLSSLELSTILKFIVSVVFENILPIAAIFFGYKAVKDQIKSQEKFNLLYYSAKLSLVYMPDTLELKIRNSGQSHLYISNFEFDGKNHSYKTPLLIPAQTDEFVISMDRYKDRIKMSDVYNEKKIPINITLKNEINQKIIVHAGMLIPKGVIDKNNTKLINITGYVQIYKIETIN